LDCTGACTEVLKVETDANATIEQLRKQLALLLKGKGGNLAKLTYKGARLLGAARIHHFWSNSHLPRFVATYDAGTDPFLQIHIRGMDGQCCTLSCRCASHPQ